MIVQYIHRPASLLNSGTDLHDRFYFALQTAATRGQGAADCQWYTPVQGNVHDKGRKYFMEIAVVEFGSGIDVWGTSG
jgi:hypothetical protein